MARSQHDIVATEIHRKALENLANEMAITLVRTSGSPTTVAAKDFCTCLLDDVPEHLGFAAFILAHLGSSLVGTRIITDIVADGDLSPGDGWLFNDPHTSGALHQGDVSAAMPTFVDGEHLGWGFVNLHVLDIGGIGISGFAPGAHDVWQEGLRLPPVRVIRDGALDPEWANMIAANVRMPGPVLNDIRSMIAANNTAARKLAEIVREYGVERHRAYCDLNKRLSEQVLRERISRIPDGVYEAVNWTEFDGHGGEDLLLRMGVSLEVADTDMRFTFSGVPQIDGFVNSSEGAMLGMTMGAIVTTLAYGDMPVNGGIWRPIQFDLGEPGSIVNSTPPAPVSMGHGEVGAHGLQLVRDVLNQALSLSSDPVLRGRVNGRGQDGFPAAALFGANQHGGSSVMFYVDNASGGGGPAQTVCDGQDTYGFTVQTGCGVEEVEIHEASDPLLFLWRRVVPDSGGPGSNRGGLGMEEAYTLFHSDYAAGPAWNCVAQAPPHAFGGGYPPAASEFQVIRETNIASLIEEGRAPSRKQLTGRVEETASKVTHLAMRRNDVFVATTGGGGGLGEPLLRDPALVAADVDGGYVTAGQAEVAYGVLLGGDGAPDLPATEARRAEILRERIGGVPTGELRAPAGLGVSVVRADAQGGWCCGYCDSVLAPEDGNWRAGNVVSRAANLSSALAERGQHAHPRDTSPLLLLRQYYCASCAGVLSEDVTTDDIDALPAPALLKIETVDA